MWFEARLYSRDQNLELLNALVEYQAVAEHDVNANIVFQLSESASSPESFVGMVYLKPVERPAVFSSFLRLVPYTNMINSTIGNLLELSNAYSAMESPARFVIQ